MTRLSKTEARTIHWLAQGAGPTEIAKVSRKSIRTVKARLFLVYKKLDVDGAERHPRIRLAVYLHCELFRIGLKELGLAA